MRASPWLIPLFAAALGACHPPADPTASAEVSLAVNNPATSGLWVQTVADGDRTLVTRYCLDPAAAQGLAAFDRQLAGRCARREIGGGADGAWRFFTACDMGAWGRLAAEGVAHGDFTRGLTLQADARTSGAAAPAVNGRRRLTVQAAWQGACPADMKPGDVVWPNGTRARLESLALPS